MRRAGKREGRRGESRHELTMNDGRGGAVPRRQGEREGERPRGPSLASSHSPSRLVGMPARRPVALVGLFAQRAKESPGRAEGVKGIKAKELHSY